MHDRENSFEEKVLKFEEETKMDLSGPKPATRYNRSGRFVPWLISWELKYILTWPFVYGMLFPLLLLDVCASIYQAICFRIYGIPRVDRSDYFPLKRHKLGYLNLIEKLNCDYCGYANGLIAFAREVFARTEQYWCPIKHANKLIGAHERYGRFLDYGEADGYQSKVEGLRKALSTEAP